MQVFAPYPDIHKSVQSLDPKRLGNQIYRECLTLIKGGWPNHPASKIWVNHKKALAKYALAGLDELSKRGKNYPHHILTFQKVFEDSPDTGFPILWGREDFHLSHQSNLIRKNPSWYISIFGNVRPDLEYVWK